MSNYKKQYEELERAFNNKCQELNELNGLTSAIQDELIAIKSDMHEVIEKIQIEEALVETLSDELQEAEDELKAAEHTYRAAKAHFDGLKGQLEAVKAKHGFEDRGDFMVGAVGTPSVSFGPRYASVGGSNIGNKVYDGHTKAIIYPTRETVNLHGFRLSGSDSGNYTLTGVVSGDSIPASYTPVEGMNAETLADLFAKAMLGKQAKNDELDAFFAELISAAK